MPAFESRDYDRARDALEKAGQTIAFREKLDTLRREWTQIVGTDESQDEESRAHRCDLGRVRRGLRTLEQEYYRPIQQALQEFGGSSPLGDVLARVHELMKGLLRDVDFEPLASDPNLPQWRNAAQWARNSMAREGLLKDNSPRGTWEISDSGEQYLAEA